MANKTYKIYTLGCKVNQYDSRSLQNSLRHAGFVLVNKNAQIVIINTCCVTKTAIHKCKRMINKAKKENPKARIAVMGCWPVAYPKDVKNLKADLIWGVGEIDKLVKKIISLPVLPISKPFNRMKIKGGDRSRYFIKIQDGCEQFCSYCIIPYTRGKMNSRSMKEIINEAEQAVKAGYRELVLCGIHLGLYGKEAKSRESGINLSLLLKKIIKIKNLGRIRLSSIEVTEVSDELIKLIAQTNLPLLKPWQASKICRHLHIPLQSGCDKILKLMNRPYSIKNYKLKIKNIKKIIPDISITTDVIVGFPSETKKNFKETYDFIKEMRFSRLHVFPFSAHEKTTAAKLQGKVEKEEIATRAKKLRQLGKKLEEEYRKRFIGMELEVVVENIKQGVLQKYICKTEYYFDVEKEIENDKDIKIKEIIKIKL